ncbi:MAG: hypothetical protein JXR16_09220 [Bermanella sp.]
MISRVLIAVICLISNSAWAEQIAGLRTDILLASPAMAIDDIDSSWQNPSPGDYAQARARLEAYFTINSRWTVGFEKRWHYLLNFSEDTAQFYSRLENNTIENGEYDLSLSINAASSKGAFAQYFIPLSSKVSILLTGHLLKGDRIQDGELSGAGVVSDASLSYEWQLDYAYDENRIFEAPRKNESAWGYSFDLNMQWQLNKKQTLELAIEDLLYTLYWNGVDQDKGCLDRPLSVDCSVYSSREAYTQTFPMFVRVKWQYDFESVQTSIEAQTWQRYNALLLGVGQYGFQAQFDTINEKINLGYESSRVKVKWAFDQADFAQAKHWQLSLDMNWPIL